MANRKAPSTIRSTRAGGYRADVDTAGMDDEMKNTLGLGPKGDAPTLGMNARYAKEKVSTEPDYIKKGKKAYFKGKSYSPEQRNAITKKGKRYGA